MVNDLTERRSAQSTITNTAGNKLINLSMPFLKRDSSVILQIYKTTDEKSKLFALGIEAATPQCSEE